MTTPANEKAEVKIITVKTERHTRLETYVNSVTLPLNADNQLKLPDGTPVSQQLKDAASAVIAAVDALEEAQNAEWRSKQAAIEPAA